MNGLGRFFIKDGKATQLGGLVVQLLALAAIVAVIGLGYNNILGWLILSASGTAILVVGMAYGAQAIGLKPFTNDPLGWRKAKKSYENEGTNSASKPGLIGRLFRRK
ncbi:MAG: hypothetical protein WC023_15000 [Rhodocyclaceae bacterium]